METRWNRRAEGCVVFEGRAGRVTAAPAVTTFQRRRHQRCRLGGVRIDSVAHAAGKCKAARVRAPCNVLVDSAQQAKVVAASCSHRYDFGNEESKSVDAHGGFATDSVAVATRLLARKGEAIGRLVSNVVAKYQDFQDREAAKHNTERFEALIKRARAYDSDKVPDGAPFIKVVPSSGNTSRHLKMEVSALRVPLAVGLV